MSNLRDRHIYSERSVNRNSNSNRVPRADRNQIYQQSLVNQTPKAVNGQPTSPEPLDHQDGYVQGNREHAVKTALQERDNENAARGMLLGIVFASLASAVIAALFIANQNPTSTPVAPVAVPVNPQNVSPAPSPQVNNPQVRERVIERTQEVVIPVPQTSTGNPQQGTVNSAPVNQAPVNQTAPQSPSQPQGQGSQPQTQTNPSIQTQPQRSTQIQGTGTQVTPLQGTGTQGAQSQEIGTQGGNATTGASGTSAQ